MRTLEFGNAVEVSIPVYEADKKLALETGRKTVVEELLDFNYEKTKELAFPEYAEGYEIRTSGVQGRPYIYRLDGENVSEKVEDAYYGKEDEEGEWIYPTEEFALPEGHATGIRYYQQFGWYALVPEDLVIPPSDQKPFTLPPLEWD